MMPVQAELEREGAILVTKEGKLTRIVALTEPDVSALSRENLQAVDWWIEHISRDHTAGTISEKSHDYAWEIARMGEEVPMHAAFANRIRDPKADELEWAKEAARLHGLR